MVWGTSPWVSGSHVTSFFAINGFQCLGDNQSSSIFFGGSLWVPNRARAGSNRRYRSAVKVFSVSFSGESVDQTSDAEVL